MDNEIGVRKLHKDSKHPSREFIKKTDLDPIQKIRQFMNVDMKITKTFSMIKKIGLEKHI